MKKVFIDEYLSVQLRQRIDELVDLNLDWESILSLLSNDLYGYADYMLEEIKRYLKYVIWLNDHHKDRNLAFEKYKKQTNQVQIKAEILPPISQKNDQQKDLTNELFLAQLRKERKRIDEISNLHYANKAEEKVEQKAEEQTAKSLRLDAKHVDEILESLSDEEIQETLSEFLTKNFDSTLLDLNHTNLNQEEKFEKDGGANDKKEPKGEPSILDEPTGKQNPKTLVSPTKKIADLTFDDILTDHSTTLSKSEPSQTLFDFDYLEDNGTETLNDSILLEDEELNLQSFTTHQTLTPSSNQTNSEFNDVEQTDEIVIEQLKDDQNESEFKQISEQEEVDEAKIDLEKNAILDESEELEKAKLDSEKIASELDQSNQTVDEEIQESFLDQIEELESEDLSEEDEEFEIDQTEEPLLDESEELENLDETNQALNFLDELEDKYGDQTLVTLNAKVHDLETTNFTLAEPTSTLKIGVHVHYQNHDYVVENIEIELDFFHHQQTILTLIDVENQNKIQINAKKIK